MKIIFVTSVTYQRRQIEYHQIQSLLIGNVNVHYFTSAVCAIWLVITYFDKIKFTMIRRSYFIGKTMNITV